MNSIVLTDTARQGLFRYFPGVPNAGATAAVPTVDLAGNPRKPATAAGDLQSLPVFGRDPNRMVADSSGLIKKVLDGMPQPNNFEAAGGVDGLNTARFSMDTATVRPGHTFGRQRGRLHQPRPVQFPRVDHHFSDKHKANFAGTLEHAFADLSLSQWPSGYNGMIDHHPKIFTGSFVSTITPSLVNEFRFGFRQGRLDALQAYDHPKTGNEARQAMGVKNGIPFTIEGTLWGQSAQVFADNGSIGNKTPLLTLGNNVSWMRGKHAFKGGVEFRHQARQCMEFRRDRSGGSSRTQRMVRTVGSDSLWNGREHGTARVLQCRGRRHLRNRYRSHLIPGHQQHRRHPGARVADGSVGFGGQHQPGVQVCSPDPTNLEWLDYSQYYEKRRDFRQTEMSFFFKDDWKIRQDLTLNLGLRYEWYGVPYESHGMMAAPVGGSSGLFGRSGSSFEDWYRPGERGTDTLVEFVGKNSPNPEKLLYNNDWNNIGPSVGLSWSLPWGGKDKTVLRAGYGIAYQGRFAGRRSRRGHQRRSGAEP